MTFSKRLGIEPRDKPLQLKSIDKDLMNSLWNLFYTKVLKHIASDEYDDYNEYAIEQFRLDFAIKLTKYQVDEMPPTYFGLKKSIKEYFFKTTWNKVYELIEFYFDKDYVAEGYLDEIDNVLQIEFSGYRVINMQITPISNDLEVDSIKNALESGFNFTGFEGVNIHLSKALKFLSDREHPDYGNSIKESVSAVESATKKLTGETTLGNALNKLEKSGIEINNQLKESFNKVYAFSNDKNSGIRHAVVENHKPADFETAQYLLVTSSAFINYLISLSRKTQI